MSNTNNTCFVLCCQPEGGQFCVTIKKNVAQKKTQSRIKLHLIITGGICTNFLPIFHRNTEMTSDEVQAFFCF